MARWRVWLVALALAACKRDRDDDGVSSKDDCDDLDPTVMPGADEVCDGIDQDCDGLEDESPTDGIDFFVDGDGDGYGANPRTVACALGDGLVSNDDDCDDADGAVHPNASEEVVNGNDDDCDEDVDEDADPDTGWYSFPPLLIYTLGYDCLPDDPEVGDVWTYAIEVNAPHLIGRVIADDTVTGRHEEHDLVGAGLELRATLVGANEGPPDQRENVSTVFECGDDDAMVWRYEIYGPAGELTNCVVASGDDTTPEVVWGADLDGCDNSNAW